MLRGLWLAAAFLVPTLAPADEPFTVKVLTPDGKPAAGATAWYYRYPAVGKPAPEPPPQTVSAAGELTLSPAPDAKSSFGLFVRDAAGRMSAAGYNAVQDIPPAERTLTLVEFVQRSGRVTTADGKPVAGATVRPYGFSNYDRMPTLEEAKLPRYIGPPPWAKLPAVPVDAHGRFEVGVPAGYDVTCEVVAEGYGKSSWTTKAGQPVEPVLATPGRITLAVDGIDPTVLKGSYLGFQRGGRNTGTSLTSLPAGDVEGKVRQTFANIQPGDYTLRLNVAATAAGTLVPPSGFTVGPGQETVVTLKFVPPVTITGKVVDPAGKGVPKVNVYITGRAEANGPQTTMVTAVTDESGAFTGYGSAGWYTAGASEVPDDFALPDWRKAAAAVKVEAGQAKELAPIKLIAAAEFVGRVRDGDGKPVAAAAVWLATDHLRRGQEGRKTDADGQFTIGGLAPDDAVAPRIRVGKAVNVPKAYELDKTGGPVTIELSEENAAAFTGRVLSGDGKPAAGVRVTLYHMVPMVGRGGGGSFLQQVVEGKTDADGRYRFAAMWPGDQTHAVIEAAGYAKAETKRATGVADQTHDFGDTQLARDGLVVRGVVRNADGTPAAGAGVFGIGNLNRPKTQAAADGSFALPKMPEGGGFVLAKAPGTKLALVPVTGGTGKPVTLMLAKADGVPVPPPAIQPAHEAAIDALAKHLLTRLWEDRGTSRRGGRAIEGMAHLDPVTARQWVEEEKVRSGGKTDYTATVEGEARAAKRLADAKADPDEAVASVARMNGTAGYYEAMRLARAVLPTDKATALRFAEEAVVKARAEGLPNRVYLLSHAGDLAVRAGGAGGRKVITEAAAEALKLAQDVNGRNGLALGLSAADLAAYDWPKAEAMLDTLKSGDDYNRFLAAAIPRVARTDFAQAKAMLGQFKPANSFYPAEGRLRLAYAVAATQPDEALALVGGVSERPYRVEGYVHLAKLFAATDKVRAFRTIDAAFAVMENEPEEFRSWGSISGVAGQAAIAVYRAKQIGYPDVPQLVARTVALLDQYEPFGTYSPERYAGVLVNDAAALALTDPAAARGVLAGVAPPDEFVTLAAGKSRDYLFALALADPERAVKLVDLILERAKTNRSPRGLSLSGITELSLILTAPDRMTQLTQWATLNREMLDE